MVWAGGKARGLGSLAQMLGRRLMGTDFQADPIRSLTLYWRPILLVSTTPRVRTHLLAAPMLHLQWPGRAELLPGQNLLASHINAWQGGQLVIHTLSAKCFEVRQRTWPASKRTAD